MPYRTLIAATLALAACAHAQSRTALPFDDAAIVGILDSANAWDIATGSLAATRAARQDIRDFGALLVRDHKTLQDSGRALATKLKITPRPVPADFPLKVAHDMAMKTLQGLSGAAFDKAFLEHEVAYHKAVIEAMNRTLMPAIKSLELKASLQQAAPTFTAHQQAAETLLKKP
jgi:putative membrane protein